MIDFLMVIQFLSRDRDGDEHEDGGEDGDEDGDEDEASVAHHEKSERLVRKTGDGSTWKENGTE